MVVDGFYYALPLAIVGLLAGYWVGWGWAAPAFFLAAFVLYFFRDPERVPPAGAVIVSPADGRVVDVRETDVDGQRVWKISIFLSLFNVHVNRSPIAGVIRNVRYVPGKFLIASKPEASVENEQNTVTVEGERFTIVFKQIAGVLARRIVFRKHVGDSVRCGERIGLIKFGSRVDLFLPLDLRPQVKVGDRVSGGTSIMASPPESTAEATLPAPTSQPANAAVEK